MDWQQEKKNEASEGIWAYYLPKIHENPMAVLSDIEQELHFQCVRYGNNWTGRGVVMDTIIAATIHALEEVRLACIEKIEESSSQTNTSRKIHRSCQFPGSEDMKTEKNTTYKGWNIRVWGEDRMCAHYSFEVKSPSGAVQTVTMGGENENRAFERAREMVEFELAFHGIK